MSTVHRTATRLSIAALVAAALSNPGHSWAQLPPPVNLAVPALTQGTGVWCWAAVAQQIIAFSRGLAATPPQCALVAVANGAPPAVCCGAPNPACVRPGSLQQIQALIYAFGGSFSSIAPPANPRVLYETLASGRPIILQLQSSPYMGHVVVLRGMSFLPTPMGVEPVLHINDPMSFFVQPVPFSRLMGYWQSAIVVQSVGSPTPALLRGAPQRPASPASADSDADYGAARPEGTARGSATSSADPRTEDSLCVDRCARTNDACEDRIESADDCLEAHITGCMDSCQNDYGYPEVQCRGRLCHPDVGSNVRWRPACAAAERSAQRRCEAARSRCVSSCEE